MTAGELVLVRHGETECSRSGRHTGRTDIALTDLDRRQAVLLAQKLRGEPVALVMSSPLQRARQTCEGAQLDVPTLFSDDLLDRRGEGAALHFFVDPSRVGSRARQKAPIR